MHTVDRLEAAFADARRQGYRIRFEPLGEAVSGAFELRGQKILLVDLTAPVEEQLAIVRSVLDPQRPRVSDEFFIADSFSRDNLGEKSAFAERTE